MERCISEWIINNDRQPFWQKLTRSIMLVPISKLKFRTQEIVSTICWKVTPISFRSWNSNVRRKEKLWKIVSNENDENEIAMLGWMDDNNFSLVYSGLIRGISKSVEERVSTRSVIYKTLGTRAFIPHSCFIAHETTDDPLIKQAW